MHILTYICILRLIHIIIYACTLKVKAHNELYTYLGIHIYKAQIYTYIQTKIQCLSHTYTFTYLHKNVHRTINYKKYLYIWVSIISVFKRVCGYVQILLISIIVDRGLLHYQRYKTKYGFYIIFVKYQQRCTLCALLFSPALSAQCFLKSTAISTHCFTNRLLSDPTVVIPYWPVPRPQESCVWYVEKNGAFHKLGAV